MSDYKQRRNKYIIVNQKKPKCQECQDNVSCVVLNEVVQALPDNANPGLTNPDHNKRHVTTDFPAAPICTINPKDSGILREMLDGQDRRRSIVIAGDNTDGFLFHPISVRCPKVLPHYPNFNNCLDSGRNGLFCIDACAPSVSFYQGII